MAHKQIPYYILTDEHTENLNKMATLKKNEISFQDQVSLYAGLKYCRVQGEHSARRLTFIKLPFVITIFVLSIF